MTRRLMYLCLSIVACGGRSANNGGAPAGPNGPSASSVTSIVLTPSSASIDSAQSTTLTASVSWSGPTGAPNLAWTSSDTSVLGVSATSDYTAKAIGRKGGSAMISASSGGKVGSAAITVRPDMRIRTMRALAFSKRITPFAGGPTNSEVVVIRAGEDSLINLTFHPASDFSPVWSPDARQILFATTRDDPTAGDVLANFALYVVPASGGASRRVAGLGSLGRVDYAWNPSSGRVHIVRFGVLVELEGMYVVSADGNNFLRLGTAETLVPASITGPYSLERLTFSHDASQLAYILNERVYVATFGLTPAPRAITSNCSFPTTCRLAPAWSADDQRIAVLRDGGLWVVTVATGQATRVADSDALVTPSWSPNGSELAYVHAGRVRTVNLSTGVTQLLAADAQADALGEISWSSDGALVAYSGAALGGTVTIVRRSDLVTRTLVAADGSGFPSRMRWAPR